MDACDRHTDKIRDLNRRLNEHLAAHDSDRRAQRERSLVAHVVEAIEDRQSSPRIPEVIEYGRDTPVSDPTWRKR